MKIQTYTGLTDIDKLVIGDKLYEYETGNRLLVTDLKYSNNMQLYNLTLTDGRSTIYNSSDYYYLNGEAYSITKMLKNIDDITKTPITENIYDYQYIGKTIYPDTYMAGAVLVNGDQTSKFINLPIDQSYISYYMQLTYGIYPASFSDGRQYFSNNPYDTSELMEWQTLFPNHDIYAKSADYPKIPLDYMRNSIDGRWLFVRGAFSSGCYEKSFPNRISLSADGKDVLIDMQTILRSLGVASCVVETQDAVPGKPFSLFVTGKHATKYDMFCNPNVVRSILSKDPWLNRSYETSCKTYIKSITPAGIGQSVLVTTEYPRQVFMTDNFMPRIST